MKNLSGKTPLKMWLQLLKKFRALSARTLLPVGMWILRGSVINPIECTDGSSFLFCPRYFFFFLLWNAYFAWIPVILLELPTAHSKYGLVRWATIGLAVLFFTNAPYLITDLIHLRPRTGVPLWYDALLLFSFAYLGLMLALQALRQIRAILQDYAKWVKEVVTLGTLVLSGLGIYLGRVVRWNSWEAFLSPRELLSDIVKLLKAPSQHLEDWLMMLLFSLMLACVYWLQQDTLRNNKPATH